MNNIKKMKQTIFVNKTNPCIEKYYNILNVDFGFLVYLLRKNHTVS